MFAHLSVSFFAFVGVSRVIEDVVHNNEESVRFLISIILGVYNMIQKTENKFFVASDLCSVGFFVHICSLKNMPFYSPEHPLGIDEKYVSKINEFNL